MDLRMVRPMVAKDLNTALEFIEKAMTAKYAQARNTLLVSAEDNVRSAMRSLGCKEGEKSFAWKLPGGRTQKTTGRTAQEAANQLGIVVGWVDDDTVTVTLGGRTFEAKLEGVVG